jgi:O-antigen/teichoic acid export membrane protein
MNSLKKQAIKGVKWATASTVILTIIAIVKISILTRFLEKSDFGLFAIVMFILNFVNLFLDLGITSAIIHKQNISKHEYASLYWLNILFSIVLYLILIVITPLISSFYKFNELNRIIPIFSIAIILTAIGSQHRIVWQKELEFKMIAIIDVFSAFVSLPIVLFFAYKGYGVYALVYATLIQYAISSFLFLISGIKRNRIMFYFNFRETIPFLKIGIFQTGGQILNYFNRDIDILIIGKFYNPAILGSYSLAKQLVFRPLQIINPIVSQVSSPVLAQIQRNLEQLKVSFLKMLNLVSTANAIAYLLLIIFAKYIILILYGPSYENTTILVQILSVYLYFRSIGNPVGSLLIATGKTHYDFYWNMVVLVIVPIFVIAGSLISINMVAVFLSISSILLLVPNWYFLIRKLINVTFYEYLYNLIPNVKVAYTYILSKK